MDIKNSFYFKKNKKYYNHIRKDVLPLLPQKINRLLEVGCGFGNTLNYIKENRQCNWLGGVELIPEVASISRKKLDFVVEGDIESLDLQILAESIDFILCLDVLEHLIDPWSVISKLDKLLKPGGAIIASIPNIRNLHVLIPLIFKGKWEYGDEGLLDRTHLRFFTRSSAIKLIESSGLKVDIIRDMNPDKSSKRRISDLLTFSIFKEFFVSQYLFRAWKEQK
jgi:SAM-dependent methyltransferase